MISTRYIRLYHLTSLNDGEAIERETTAALRKLERRRKGA